MRKITIFLAILALATPSIAYAKKKHHHHHHHHRPVVTTPSDPNEAGRRLVWNGMMLVFVPFQPLMPR